MGKSNSEATLARKRRIAMRNKQRSSSFSPSSLAHDDVKMAEENLLKRSRSTTDDKSIAVSSLSSVCVEEVAQDIEQRKKKPHLTGIKKLSRYDPGVSMTKEELKAWRKEARRVRNRESAAASRKKKCESIQK